MSITIIHPYNMGLVVDPVSSLTSIGFTDHRYERFRHLRQQCVPTPDTLKRCASLTGSGTEWHDHVQLEPSRRVRLVHTRTVHLQVYPRVEVVLVVCWRASGHGPHSGAIVRGLLTLYPIKRVVRPV